MGADMCVAVLVNNAKRTLNWDDGRRVIEKLPYEEHEGTMQVCNDQDIWYSKVQLLIHLKTVEEAYLGVMRDATVIENCGNEILLSGGMTWGDDPTETYTAIVTLDDMTGDILEAVGFHRDEDDKDWRPFIGKLLKNKEILPLLMGMDSDLDNLINKRLQK
jgi:hypothetical protein